VAERGEPLAVLNASESVIYSRFGYGLATFITHWTMRTEGTVLASPSRAEGRIRLVEPKDASTIVPALYDSARKRRVGEVTRGADVWQRQFGDRPDGKGPRKVFTAIHESSDGQPDGYARYRVQEDWSNGIATHSIEVQDLCALDDEVDAALWQFLL